MTRRRPDAGGDGRHAPLRLLPPVLVLLSAEQERQAVDALAGLLTGLLERQKAAWGEVGTGDRGRVADLPDDDEAA